MYVNPQATWTNPKPYALTSSYVISENMKSTYPDTK